MKNKTESRYALTKNEFIFLLVMLAVFFVLFSVATGLIYLQSPKVAGSSYVFLALIFLITASLLCFIYFSEPEILKAKRKVVALLFTMLVSYLLIIGLTRLTGVYAAPLCLCALITALLVSNKVSFFSNFAVVLIFYMAEAIHGNLGQTELYYCLLTCVVTGIISSYALSVHVRRSHFLLISCYTGLASIAIAGILYLMIDYGSLNNLGVLFMLAKSLISGVTNIMLFFVFVPLFEKLFNVVSDFRYAELSSTNQPLLRQLLDDAPGTFNHSMIVSNYVEACAAAIREDTYLARCAALYHDIGKLKQPQYFIENQQGGKNPHDEIAPELSVMFIKKHITNGLALADEYKLPNEIKSVIGEHHGTMPIMFFYEKAKKYSETPPDIKLYSYDGDCPTSKISAIVMIADASEAALRALSIERKNMAADIVDRIIMDRLYNRQFIDCDITLKELMIIKDTIVTSFLGVKHERIVYPGQEKLLASPDKPAQ